MLLETVGNTPTKHKTQSAGGKKSHRRQKSDQNPLTLEENPEDQSPTPVSEEAQPSTSIFSADGAIGRLMSSLRRGRRKKFYGSTASGPQADDSPPGNTDLPYNDSNGRLLIAEEDDGDISVSREASDRFQPADPTLQNASFITRTRMNNNNNLRALNNNYSGSENAYQRVDSSGNVSHSVPDPKIVRYFDDWEIGFAFTGLSKEYKSNFPTF